MNREVKILYNVPSDPNLIVDRKCDDPIILEDLKLEAELRAAYYKRQDEKKSFIERQAQVIMDNY